VLVTSFACHVKPENERELRASLGTLMEHTRWQPGCLGCRLVSSSDDSRALTLIHEWSDRGALDRFLGSGEYRVLRGMRFLMDEEPRLAVDEVVVRARIPITPDQE
jgi:quinol monooxygenase YgiN